VGARLATLSGLFVYPLKSARGVALERARVDPRGIEHDRRWMVVDERGGFVSQRTHPRLALVTTALDGAALRLFAPDLPDLEVLPPGGGPLVPVRVWNDDVAARPAPAAASAWVSEHLRERCTLVHLPDAAERRVGAAFRPASLVSFADAFPFLLLSEASLAELNRRLVAPVSMDRFRPNLVVSGCAPHAEDSWPRIRIGAVGFTVAKPCARCVVVTTDQSTGERHREPLATLSTYRLHGGMIMFGQNLIHEREGELAVGGLVEAADPA
jgi:uncharacterized protein YcbX